MTLVNKLVEKLVHLENRVNEEKEKIEKGANTSINWFEARKQALDKVLSSEKLEGMSLNGHAFQAIKEIDDGLVNADICFFKKIYVENCDGYYAELCLHSDKISIHFFRPERPKISESIVYMYEFIDMYNYSLMEALDKFEKEIIQRMELRFHYYIIEPRRRKHPNGCPVKPGEFFSKLKIDELEDEIFCLHVIDKLRYLYR